MSICHTLINNPSFYNECILCFLPNVWFIRMICDDIKILNYDIRMLLYIGESMMFHPMTSRVHSQISKIVVSYFKWMAVVCKIALSCTIRFLCYPAVLSDILNIALIVA